MPLKYHKMKKYLLITLILVSFAACSDDDDYTLPPLSDYTFSVVDGQIIPDNIQPISNGCFQTKIQGYGWQEVTHSYILNDGTLTPSMAGADYISHHYFKGDRCTVFTHFIYTALSSASGGLEHSKSITTRDYRYENNIINMEGSPYMTILSYDDENKVLVAMVQKRLCFYHRMLPVEVKKMVKEYANVGYSRW